MFNTSVTSITLLIIYFFSFGKNSYPPSQATGPPINPSDSLQVRIVFYNVENLFYPVDDSTTLDDDFTPEGLYHWTFYRYRHKLNTLAKVFVAIGEGTRPAVIGLCEIENRKVLHDLCNRTLLKSFGYKIIHQESHDPRGIDVALLYDPTVFLPEDYSSIGIHLEDGRIMRSRDILKVSGFLNSNKKCYFFVNHWPSRRGGKLASEKKRISAAKQLKSEFETVLRVEPEANVIIMGDFNDEPDDISIRHILGACGFPDEDCDSARLLNMMYRHHINGEGTHYRKNNFIEAGVLDQILVTPGMINNQNGIKVKDGKASIFRKKYMLNEKNGMPLRTFQGLKYLGGISDHLPVYLDIILFENYQ